MTPEWLFDEAELLDPEAREVPPRLAKEDLLAASDAGWRRCVGRLDDMEDDR